MRNIHVTRNNVICGDKDPIINKVIPKFVGQQYIMINTDQVFFAKGTTHNDWIEASSSIDDIDLSGLATKEEIDAIARATVVDSQYGQSVCFMMKAGGQTYIPLDANSNKATGDTVDLNNAKLITLGREGEKDIYRVSC